MTRRTKGSNQIGLADIEAAADRRPEADPARARDLLGDDAGQPDDAPPPPRRGRPRGSGGKETKAQAIARADAAEARLAALDGAPDEAEQLAALSAALGGSVEMITGLWVGTHQDRQAWRWTPEELSKWGDLWAVPLLPYLPALGSAAPWVMAGIGSFQLWNAKAQAVAAEREKAAPAEVISGDSAKEGGQE